MSGRFDSPLCTETAKRNRRKRVPTEDGRGHIDDGQEQYVYEVNIDWRDVHHMAIKAAESKGGQCIAGPVQVKIRSRKVVQQ